MPQYAISKKHCDFLLMVLYLFPLLQSLNSCHSSMSNSDPKSSVKSFQTLSEEACSFSFVPERLFPCTHLRVLVTWAAIMSPYLSRPLDSDVLKCRTRVLCRFVSTQPDTEQFQKEREGEQRKKKKGRREKRREEGRGEGRREGRERKN